MGGIVCKNPENMSDRILGEFMAFLPVRLHWGIFTPDSLSVKATPIGHSNALKKGLCASLICAASLNSLRFNVPCRKPAAMQNPKAGTWRLSLRSRMLHCAFGQISRKFQSKRLKRRGGLLKSFSFLLGAMITQSGPMSWSGNIWHIDQVESLGDGYLGISTMKSNLFR